MVIDPYNNKIAGSITIILYIELLIPFFNLLKGNRISPLFLKKKDLLMNKSFIRSNYQVAGKEARIRRTIAPER